MIDYICAVLNLYSRKIAAWAMVSNMATRIGLLCLADCNYVAKSTVKAHRLFGV